MSPTAAPTPPPLRCHACDQPIEGEPAGSGVLVFVRAGAPHYEDQPLCESCSLALAVMAQRRFQIEEEEG